MQWYTYLFEMETELHLPDDAPVVVEAAGELRAVDRKSVV